MTDEPEDQNFGDRNIHHQQYEEQPPDAAEEAMQVCASFIILFLIRPNLSNLIFVAISR